MEWHKITDDNLPPLGQEIILCGKTLIVAHREAGPHGEWSWWPHISKKYVSHFGVPDAPVDFTRPAPLLDYIEKVKAHEKKLMGEEVNGHGQF